MPSPARRTPDPALAKGYRSLAVSLLLHVAVLGGAAALACSTRPATTTTPVVFAVLDSMFRPDAPPAADAAKPSVEVLDEPTGREDSEEPSEGRREIALELETA